MKDYQTRFGSFVCLMPKLAIVAVIVLRGYGVITWAWLTVGGVVFLLVMLWLALDREYSGWS